MNLILKNGNELICSTQFPNEALVLKNKYSLGKFLVFAYIPRAIIGIRPMYFMIEPKMIEQIALTTPKQIIT